MASIETAELQESYRFSYTAISPLFMACLSGVEDVDGSVDAERSVVVLSSRQRGGDLYSLDGELVIDRDLLRLPDNGRSFARIPLDATTEAETLDRLEAALGTSLSALVAGGAWPTHPNELVRSMLPLASSITSIESDGSKATGIQIVLDSAAYLEEFDEATSPTDEVAPIIEAHVDSDGTVARLVVRLPDAADPTSLTDHSGGYAMDYIYEPTTEVVSPDADTIADIGVSDLPLEPTPIPCQLEQ